MSSQSHTVPWAAFERSERLSSDRFTKINNDWRSVNEKIIVLDDDPTGCQTVHDVPVYLSFEEESIRDALQSDAKLIFFLTNIRSMTASDARNRHALIAARIRCVASETGMTTRIISRSDSTLRGHFPEDLDPFFASDEDISGIIIVPAFFEGGRFTYHGTHYVQTEHGIVRADETEFARDSAFGFKSAHLPDWVNDKWRSLPNPNIRILSIETIRHEGIDGIRSVLSELKDCQVLVVDALDEIDLADLTEALIECQRAGQKFLFRSAASFVHVYGGIEPKAKLKGEEIVRQSGTGGMVIVGSYVKKTSQQLENLLQLKNIIEVELNVQHLLGEERIDEIEKAVNVIDTSIRAGQDVVCYTSRDVVVGSSRESNLSIGNAVSDALVEVVRLVSVRPSFLVAKGGITSHRTAESGLGIKLARVLGQVLPGVPVWETGDEAKWAGLRYVVFPGNVGDEMSLAEVIGKLQTARENK